MPDTWDDIDEGWDDVEPQTSAPSAQANTAKVSEPEQEPASAAESNAMLSEAPQLGPEPAGPEPPSKVEVAAQVAQRRTEPVPEAAPADAAAPDAVEIPAADSADNKDASPASTEQRSKRTRARGKQKRRATQASQPAPVQRKAKKKRQTVGTQRPAGKRQSKREWPAWLLPVVVLVVAAGFFVAVLVATAD